METHLATNKASTNCGMLNFDNFPNLIYRNIGKKISFTFKMACEGIDVKFMLTFGSQSNKSQAGHICMWPIASIIPAELRALSMHLCTRQGTGTPLATAATPARGHQDTAPGWGIRLWKIPHRSARTIFEISAITAETMVLSYHGVYLSPNGEIKLFVSGMRP